MLTLRYNLFSFMENYIDHTLEQLKQCGLKITAPRRLIVQFLAKSRKALSPYEIREMLQHQNIKADVVTIYRVLELLEKLSLAHKVLAFNGYVRCNTKKLKDMEKRCHHYLICRKCHKVEEVEGENLSRLEEKISSINNFLIEAHYLEFTGLCATCQKSSPVKKLKAQPKQSLRRR